MALKFIKMHGLGNDFMVIDAINQDFTLSAQDIAVLSERHRGIGFDQCLVVEKSKSADIDFFYRIFNADGQEVGQCGNGARCLARFLHYTGLSDKQRIRVATKTTTMNLQINSDQTVTVDMGLPRLKPAEIPLQITDQQRLYSLPMPQGGQQLVHAINVGNPHAVLLVDDIQTAAVATLGKTISEHPLFPQQSNAGFMQIMDKNHIQLRVYERGCGETAACGSGAVAAAAIGRLFHGLEKRVHVLLPGGELLVDWPDIDSAIALTGPASFVYQGELLPCVS